MKKLVLKAEIGNIDAVVDFVNEELELHDAPMKAVMKIDVAIDEIFTNIASYAYGPEGGEATVTVEVEENPACAVIRFCDRGKPFNPLEMEEPDVTLGIDEREIGGLGIFMVKKSMDEVSYSYEDGQNVLTIRKIL